MARRSPPARRAALAGFLWGSLCLAGCAAPHGDGAPPAPWVQLEMRFGPGAEAVLWLEPSGSYEGYEGRRPLRGELTPEQVAGLRELFREERIAIYQRDALPTDGSVDLAGTAERPVYRIVVREESDDIRAGSDRLLAYFAETPAHPETSEMLAEVKRIIAEESQGP